MSENTRPIPTPEEFEAAVRQAKGGIRVVDVFEGKLIEIDSLSDKYVTQAKRILAYDLMPKGRLPRKLQEQIDVTKRYATSKGLQARLRLYKVPPPEVKKRIEEQIELIIGVD
ncbi:hypothetical protein HYR99_16580 [Candidatus Poribacteria bacterium]|nr:hypothetical protein [Candidatus Poribacteria bacterium]